MALPYTPFNKSSGTESAPFNMAISTLQRLNDILIEIKIISVDPILTDSKKQEMKLTLTKQFFLQAVPLLIKQDKGKKFIDGIKEEVTKLKPRTARYFEPNVNGKKYIGTGTLFDIELDRQLDRILFDIQSALQEEGYFMPPKNDPRFSWKQG